MYKSTGRFLFALLLAVTLGTFFVTAELSAAPLSNEARYLIQSYNLEMHANRNKLPISAQEIEAKWNYLRRMAKSPQVPSDHLEWLCESLLYGAKKADSIRQDLTKEQEDQVVQNLIRTLRLEGRMKFSEEFHKKSSGEKLDLLKNILTNYSEATHELRIDVWQEGHSDVRIPRDLFFWQLFELPFVQVQEAIHSDPNLPMFQHWAAPNAGFELNSSLQQLLEVQKALGSIEGLMVDIGSGYGVPSIVFSALNSHFSYIGYDIVPQKVEAASAIAKSWGLENARFEIRDVSDPKFVLPEAKYYYLFNPVSKDVLDLMYEKFERIPDTGKDVYIILNNVWDLPTPRGFEQYYHSPRSKIQILFKRHRGPGLGNIRN